MKIQISTAGYFSFLTRKVYKTLAAKKGAETRYQNAQEKKVAADFQTSLLKLEKQWD